MRGKEAAALIALSIALSMLFSLLGAAYGQEERMEATLIVRADEECIALSGSIVGGGEIGLARVSEGVFQTGPFREGQTIVVKAIIKDHRRCVFKGYISDHAGPQLIGYDTFSWTVDRFTTNRTINLEFVVERVEPKKIYITILNNNTACPAIFNAERLTKVNDYLWRTGPWYELEEVFIEAIPPENCFFYAWMPFLPRDAFQPTSNTLLRILAERNMTVIATLFVRGEEVPLPTVQQALPGMAFLQIMTHPLGAGDVVVSTNRPPPESELLRGLPQLLVMADPSTLVYIDVNPRGCNRLAGWRGADYAVSILKKGGELASFTLQPGFTYLEAMFEQDEECLLVLYGVRITKSDIPLIAGAAASATGSAASGLLIYARRRAKASKLGATLEAALQLVPESGRRVYDAAQGLFGVLARRCRFYVGSAGPDEPKGLEKRISDVRRSALEFLAGKAKDVLSGRFAEEDEMLLSGIKKQRDPAQWMEAQARLKNILFPTDPVEVLYLYAILRGVAPPPDPMAIAEWLSVASYANGDWRERLHMAGEAVRKKREEWLRELEGRGIDLEALLAHEPGSIRYIFQVALGEPEGVTERREEAVAEAPPKAAAEPVIEEARPEEQPVEEAKVGRERRGEEEVREKPVEEQPIEGEIPPEVLEGSDESLEILARLCKAGVRGRVLGQASLAEAEKLLKGVRLRYSEYTLIRLAQRLEERARELATRVEPPGEMEVQKGLLGEYCPMCGYRLYETMRGLLCPSCNVMYRLVEGAVEEAGGGAIVGEVEEEGAEEGATEPATAQAEEEWLIRIPWEKLKDARLLVTILENFSYYIPIRLNIGVDGHESHVYVIDEAARARGGRGRDEEEIVKSIVDDASRGVKVGVIPVLATARYCNKPWVNDFAYIDRMAKVASRLARLGDSDLKVVAVVPRTVLGRDVAQRLLEELDKEGISYDTYSYWIPDQQDSLREAGLQPREAELLLDLTKALPRILPYLRRGGPLADRILEYLRADLGDELGDPELIARACGEALRLGRRLSRREAEALGLSRNQIEILRSLNIVGAA